jgi:hypothetical protein
MSRDPSLSEVKRQMTRAASDPNYRLWTDAELGRLRELVSRVPVREAAVELGRSWTSVRRAMQVHGIKTTRPNMRSLPGSNPREVARREKTGHPGESNPNFKDGRSPRDHQRDTLIGLYLEVFSALGGECIVCGETDPLVLEVDHVENDGAEHRREYRGIPYIRELLRCAREEPGRLQLLCANDHRRKRREAGGWSERVSR